MSEIQRYVPDFSQASEAPTEAAAIIHMASPDAKRAIAKTAWNALPIERRDSDNLNTLRAAITQDPMGFLALCHQNKLPVDLSVVYETHDNRQYITHDNRQFITHQQNPDSLTKSDLIELVSALQMQPQNNGPSMEEMMAILAYQQQQTQAQTEMMLAQMASQQRRYSQPVQPVVHVSPSIHVSSHSEQDNGDGRHFVWFLGFAIFSILALVIAGEGSN